jgi:hypothetical protein
LKVRVKNNGGIIARNCRAKLKVIKNITSSRCPSDNKNLAWDTTENRYLEIAKDDDEFLHVGFSDSNFEAICKADKIDIYAMASTVESHYGAERFIRVQDAFGTGRFEIEILVRSEEGTYARAKYNLEVGENYTCLILHSIPKEQPKTVKGVISKLIIDNSYSQFIKFRKGSDIII